MKNDLYAAIESYFGITQYNLDYKYRINRLNYFQVYSGIKTLHSLPRVAIALAEAQATELFFNKYKLDKKQFNMQRLKNILVLICGSGYPIGM